MQSQSRELDPTPEPGLRLVMLLLALILLTVLGCAAPFLMLTMRAELSLVVLALFLLVVSGLVILPILRDLRQLPQAAATQPIPYNTPRNHTLQ
jgi:hypothetical protein